MCESDEGIAYLIMVFSPVRAVKLLAGLYCCSLKKRRMDGCNALRLELVNQPYILTTILNKKAIK